MGFGSLGEDGVWMSFIKEINESFVTLVHEEGHKATCAIELVVFQARPDGKCFLTIPAADLASRFTFDYEGDESAWDKDRARWKEAMAAKGMNR